MRPTLPVVNRGFLGRTLPASLMVIVMVLAGCSDSEVEGENDDGHNPHPPPDALIDYFCEGLTCVFDGGGSQTSPGDNGIIQYAWDFGEGNQAEGKTVTWTYEEAGSYTVSLTVNTSRTDTTTQIVQVSEPENNWREEARIAAPHDSGNGYFGSYVALDGDTALVGDPGFGIEAVFAFTLKDDGWMEDGRLDAPDGPGVFPAAMALSGDTAFVSSYSEAFGHNGNGFSHGEVLVFTHDGTDWNQESMLDRPYEPNGTYSEFGTQLALDGDLALVADASASEGGQGDVFVFVRVDGDWAHEAVLSPESHAPDFGRRIALSGETAWIMDEGEAFVYTRNGETWTQEARLSPPGAGNHSGPAPVVLDGDTAAVAGDQEVTVYTRDDGVWSHETTLRPPLGIDRVDYGHSLALSGNTLLVSSLDESEWDDGGGDRSVEIFAYMRTAGDWQRDGRLIVPGSDARMALGLDGDVAIAGAPRAVGGATNDTGEAVVFVRDEDTNREAQVIWRSSLSRQDHEPHRGPDVEVGDGALFVTGSSREQVWVDDGGQMLGEPKGFVRAFDVKDGTALWSDNYLAEIASAPFYHDGRVYYTLVSPGVLHVRDAIGGALLMETSYADEAGSGDPRVADGVVYVAGADHLYALDVADGSRLWRFEAEPSTSATVVGDEVFFGTHNGTVHALDFSDGSEKWRFEAGDRITSAPRVSEGSVVVTSSDRHVYVLDDSNGQEIWSFGLEESEYVFDQPVVVDGVIYLTTSSGRVSALDLGDGTPRWNFTAGQSGSHLIVFNDGVLYLTGGGVYALDVRDGSEIWRFPSPGWYSSLAVTDDGVFLGEVPTYVFALEKGAAEG